MSIGPDHRIRTCGGMWDRERGRRTKRIMAWCAFRGLPRIVGHWQRNVEEREGVKSMSQRQSGLDVQGVSCAVHDDPPVVCAGVALDGGSRSNCRCGDCWLSKTAAGEELIEVAGRLLLLLRKGSLSWGLWAKLTALGRGGSGEHTGTAEDLGLCGRRRPGDFCVGRLSMAGARLPSHRAAAWNRFWFLSLRFRGKTRALRDERSVSVWQPKSRS